MGAEKRSIRKGRALALDFRGRALIQSKKLVG
jgi:hypothetical protein